MKNKRIRELAEQAGYIDKGSNHTTYRDFNHEKFAELIIDECAHQAEIWDSEPLSGNSIAYEIKKHFEEKNT